METKKISDTTIRYFQSVIRNNIFSEAAEECRILQQIQVLERELVC